MPACLFLVRMLFSDVLSCCALAVGMCFATYVGSVGTVPIVKWLWFFIALLLFVPIVYVLLREFRQSVIGAPLLRALASHNALAFPPLIV